MKMVPLFYCDDMAAALAFYTQKLDFELLDPQASADDHVVLIIRDGAALMLTRLPLDQKPAIAANVVVDDIDALFARFTARGLDQSHRTESPVHLAPVDQSWGTREHYVTDPAGNTLRFVQWPR
jgi:catechol 2,3-dioxygenase-like lactoylglutathione lyase family enzyme